MLNRDFRFITRGKIVDELFEEGLTTFSFSQLHRFEKKGIVPIARRTGGGWRVYSRQEADEVKRIIWKWYGGKKSYQGLPPDLKRLNKRKFPIPDPL